MPSRPWDFLGLRPQDPLGPGRHYFFFNNALAGILILISLRIDNCDERRIYKSGDISRPKGGIFTFNTSPKSSDFCLSNDIW